VSPRCSRRFRAGRGLHVLDGRRQPEAVEPGIVRISSLSLARLLASSRRSLLAIPPPGHGWTASPRNEGRWSSWPPWRRRRNSATRAANSPCATRRSLQIGAGLQRPRHETPRPAQGQPCSPDHASRSRRRHRGASASCVYAAVGPSPVNCARWWRRSRRIQRLICEKRQLGHSYRHARTRIWPNPGFRQLGSPATTATRTRHRRRGIQHSRRESTSLPPQSDRLGTGNSSNLAYNAYQDSAASHPGSDDRPGPPAGSR